MRVVEAFVRWSFLFFFPLSFLEARVADYDKQLVTMSQNLAVLDAVLAPLYCHDGNFETSERPRSISIGLAALYLYLYGPGKVRFGLALRQPL